MQQIMETNLQILRSITETADHLNIESDVRLFTDDHVLDPTDELADFTEPAFGEYAPVDTTAGWSAPVKDIEGRYSTMTGLLEFLPPTAGGPVTIYGAFVTDDAEVVLAGRFTAPVDLEVGGDPIRVRVTYQRWAGLVLLDLECA